MTRVAKLDLGAQYVTAPVPVTAKGRPRTIAPRPVAYYPELGETAADAESFAAAIVASAERFADAWRNRPAPCGYDASRAPVLADPATGRPGASAAELAAWHAAQSAAVPAPGAYAAAVARVDPTLAASFAAFLARDRAQSRADAAILGERARAAARAERARAESARVAQLLASSGPTAAELRYAGGRIVDDATVTRYQDAPAPSADAAAIVARVQSRYQDAPEPIAAESTVSAERIAEIRSAADGQSTEYGRMSAIVAAAMAPEPAPEPGPYVGSAQSWNPSRGWAPARSTVPAPSSAPVLAAVPDAPAPVGGRPACPRCGQTFRARGSGLSWHIANRPDCAAARPALAIA